MFNYCSYLSCKEQFRDQAHGGESHSVSSRRRAYGSTAAPLPSTDPPSSFPRERFTSQNLITLLTCPICSVAGREGFNYICVRHTGEPSFSTHPRSLSTTCKMGKAQSRNLLAGQSGGAIQPSGLLGVTWGGGGHSVTMDELVFPPHSGNLGAINSQCRLGLLINLIHYH